MFRNLWGRDIRVNGRKYKVNGVAGEGTAPVSRAAWKRSLIPARRRILARVHRARHGGAADLCNQGNKGPAGRPCGAGGGTGGGRGVGEIVAWPSGPGTPARLTRGRAVEAARPREHYPLRGPRGERGRRVDGGPPRHATLPQLRPGPHERGAPAVGNAIRHAAGPLSRRRVRRGAHARPAAGHRAPRPQGGERARHRGRHALPLRLWQRQHRHAAAHRRGASPGRVAGRAALDPQHELTLTRTCRRPPQALEREEERIERETTLAYRAPEMVNMGHGSRVSTPVRHAPTASLLSPALSPAVRSLT